MVLRAVPFTGQALPFGAHALPFAAQALAARAVPVPVPAPAPVAAVRAGVETEEVAIDPSFRFGYSVSATKTGDAKTREETRDGDVVTGSYTVADPDGRVRRVRLFLSIFGHFLSIIDQIGPFLCICGQNCPLFKIDQFCHFLSILV